MLPNVTQPSGWLITRTDRFAAVSLSPVNDWLSMHYTTHVTEFDRLFLQDKPSNAAGQYAARSPILFAHRALLEHGATSSLAIYPQEGHDVHQFPTVIDRGARIVAWFDRFMPTSTPPA